VLRLGPYFVAFLVVEILGERIQLLFPKHALLLNPIVRFLKRTGRQTAIVNPPFLSARNQTRRLKDSQVFGNGRRGDIEWFGERRDRTLAPRTPRKNVPANRIRQRSKDAIEPLVRSLAHLGAELLVAGT